MTGCNQIRPFNLTLANEIEAQGGFITDVQLTELVKILPNMLLLVRCGAGRFLTAANSTKHFVDIIERDKQDYVRDVSLPAGRWVSN